MRSEDEGSREKIMENRRASGRKLLLLGFDIIHNNWDIVRSMSMCRDVRFTKIVQSGNSNYFQVRNFDIQQQFKNINK